MSTLSSPSAPQCQPDWQCYSWAAAACPAEIRPGRLSCQSLQSGVGSGQAAWGAWNTSGCAQGGPTYSHVWHSLFDCISVASREVTTKSCMLTYQIVGSNQRSQPGQWWEVLELLEKVIAQINAVKHILEPASQGAHVLSGAARLGSQCWLVAQLASLGAGTGQPSCAPGMTGSACQIQHVPWSHPGSPLHQ